jgi:hypothetical protein
VTIGVNNIVLKVIDLKNLSALTNDRIPPEVKAQGNHFPGVLLLKRIIVVITGNTMADMYSIKVPKVYVGMPVREYMALALFGQSV